MSKTANIPGFPNYCIKPDGKVINVVTGHILKTSGKYLAVTLTHNKKEKRFTIHRLLANAFITNPKNKPQVNHIDGDKHNNKLANLEWCTASENITHARDTGLTNPPTATGEDHPHSLPVVCWDLDGIKIKTFLGASTAVEEGYAKHISHVNACCNSKRNTHNKYKWSRE